MNCTTDYEHGFASSTAASQKKHSFFAHESVILQDSVMMVTDVYLEADKFCVALDIAHRI